METYEIRYSPTYSTLSEHNFDFGENSVLINDGDLIIPGSLVPLPPGGQQTLTFMMRSAAQLDTTYFVAMRSINNASKSSPVSNIASVQITVIKSGATASFQFSMFLNLLLSVTLIVTNYLLA